MTQGQTFTERTRRLLRSDNSDTFQISRVGLEMLVSDSERYARVHGALYEAISLARESNRRIFSGIDRDWNSGIIARLERIAAAARDSDGNPEGEDRDGLRAGHDSAGPQDIAQTPGGPNA